MSPTDNHNEIIRGLHSNNETAIRQLYEMHYRPLCYFAQALVKEKAEAEDIAIETFLKLLRKKDDFDNLPDIRSFLFTTAKNAGIDFLRKAKRTGKSNKEISYLTELDESFGDNEMITAKVLQSIYTEVENLPIQCKRVFKSIFMDGKNTATIAQEMGISSQTVLNQKTKALQILRLAIYKEGLYTTAVFFCSLRLLYSFKQL